MNLKDIKYYLYNYGPEDGELVEAISMLEALESRIIDPDHPEELRDDLIELLGITDAET